MSSYAREQSIAIAAVLKASLVAQKVQAELIGSGGVQKKDKSPVTGTFHPVPSPCRQPPLATRLCAPSANTLAPLHTVADYTCQALVSSLIFSHFPEDQIVGEEDSSELNTPENAVTKTNIMRMANEAMSEVLQGEEEAAWEGVKSVKRGETEWLEIIDRGNSVGGASGREFHLILDFCSRRLADRRSH